MKNDLIKLEVSGMSCANCAAKIEKQLQSHPDLKDVNVNFANRTAYFKASIDDKLAIELASKDIKMLGYKPLTVVDQDEHEIRLQKEQKQLLLKFSFSLGIGIFLMIVSMSGLVPIQMHVLFNYIQLIISVPVVLIAGKPFLNGVVRFITGKGSDMNTLVGLGVISAMIYSSVITFFPIESLRWGLGHHAYFETAVFIIGFIQLGRYLEDKARNKTRRAIKDLISLQSKVAFVFRDGKFQETPVSEIKAGDRILIKAHERCAVDGIITKGITSIDESMMTGEAIPIKKQEGDHVLAGTLNLEGSIEVSATQVGSHTQLAHIIHMIEQAQGSKPQIQQLADKISSIFVPIIMVIALVTLILWIAIGGTQVIPNAISAAMAVLLIACPCALGLATPTAIMVGTGLAAKQGILFRNAQAIETLNKTNTIVFDKTGTLTLGKPIVLNSYLLSNANTDQNTIFEWIHELSLQSTHPLSCAVHEYLSKQIGKTSSPKLNIENIQTIPGVGIKGIFNENELFLGSVDYFKGTVFTFKSESMSIVVAGVNKTPVMVFELSDAIKPESTHIIDLLQQKNIEVHLASGDRKNIVADTSNELKISNFHAELKPKDKLDLIKSLQQTNKVVAMVGDGINDSPALNLADISIAMSTGSDVALSSSDITLLRGDLKLVPIAFSISDRTFKTIKENLFLSFIYNALMIPIAAGALYPIFHIQLDPMWAAAAMALSSISVVLNSLRLNYFKP